MAHRDKRLSRHCLLLALTLLLVACGGGGSGGPDAALALSDPAPPPGPTTAPEPEPLSETEATRFLSQATFGPSADDVDALLDKGMESWFLEELQKPPSLHLDSVLAELPEDGRIVDDNGNPLPEFVFLTSDSVWRTAIEGDDQLRQRMAFALSQILVVSANSDLVRAPQAMAHYADILTTGAFGNYRDLLEAVTYSPAMAVYLTYLRNEKADPGTGRVPDENYARELLQLFTIGLVALNPDGTAATDSDGEEVELFDNEDITGLAKVFTGLSFDGIAFDTPLRQLPAAAFHSPLTGFDTFHSHEAKAFLDTHIPAGTGVEQSIDMALDAIVAHPNVGPFIGRQLIQRFVTSDPQPAYVERVAAAFNSGRYTLESGDVVGEGRRGDLAATLAAVLFDARARDLAPRQEATFGKLREPVLRFTHWARAFSVNSADASNEGALRDTTSPLALAQHPYRSPSVFNFYRPAYIAPGTQTGTAGLTAPELQITNASSLVGYPNFISAYAFEVAPVRRAGLPARFVPDYNQEAAIADDPEALVAHLDRKLAHGALSSESRQRVVDILQMLQASSDQGRLLRARVASVLVMSTPEYIVLR